jgi:hypothetical protein
LKAAMMALRALFVLQLILGILFWTGHASGLVLLHMFLGIAFVAVFWVIGAMAAMRGARIGVMIGTFVLGLVIALFGLFQTSILPGSGHWIIQIIHLLLGVSAIGFAEMIAGRAQRGPAAGMRAA